MKTNDELMNEIRKLRAIICLLEDTRLRDMSIMDRPDLADAVMQVHLDRNADHHGHGILPTFE